MRAAVFLFAALTAAPAWAQEAPAAADYTLNAAASTLFVVVKKDPSTLGAAMAHDHAIAASGWTGQVHWEPANPAACKVAITVPITGLQVDPPGYRAKAGLNAQEVSAGDKQTITDNFRGASQLNASAFPTIQFTSTACSGTGGKYEVAGNLSLRGKSRPTKLTMSISADGTTFKASGRFDAKGSDWGMAPFSAAFGAVKNLDTLTFVIDVVGAR